MKCPKCYTEMIDGIALKDKMSGIPDFPGTKHVCTLSASGKADVVKTWKCLECGYQVTK